MHRVVIFPGHAWGAPAVLVRGVLKAVVARNDMVLSAICPPKPLKFTLTLWRRLLLRTLFDIESFLAPTMKPRSTVHLPVNLDNWAKRHQFKILVPEAGNINHPRFLARLRKEINPTIALSFYCPQKFSPDLLGIFKHAVNYHNGLLPKYRGIMGTAWSVYKGEKETGFTFHHMDEAFDEGAVLMQGALPVDPGRKPSDLDFKKALTAVKRIPNLLDKIASGDPGVPQCGEGSYYSEKDSWALTRIAEPSLLTSVELKKRLQAFESLKIRIDGAWHVVTKFRQLNEGSEKKGRFRIRTSDGAVLEPVRFRHHPYGIYRVLSFIRGFVSKHPT
ncbi:MAG: hypothetical protein JRK53_05515 [Deltaproteobacteria bacterium]|nr:hypothetical protein [Deltaproteobacteria bacterium]